MWKKIAIICSVALGTLLIVSSVLWFFVPHEYSSQVRVLVIQKYTFTDSYTAAKSAEKISKELAAAIHTSSFIDRVSETKQVNIDALLALPEKEKRKKWNHIVSTDIVSNTSIIEVTAFNEHAAQAQALVEAISTVMIQNGDEYYGAGDTVDLRVVDSALTSSHPTRPNIALYGMTAALLSGLVVAMLLFIHPSFPFAFSLSSLRRQEKRIVQSPIIRKQPLSQTPPKPVSPTFVQQSVSKKIVAPLKTPDLSAVIDSSESKNRNTASITDQQTYQVMHAANYHQHLHSNTQPVPQKKQTQFHIMPKEFQTLNEEYRKQKSQQPKKQP
ncbi:MAG TPA: hypothetical protein VJB65_01160 [Patescibacteria group bacterium]|nr:hypothetical protein [Patescibacteria group bacterium]